MDRVQEKIKETNELIKLFKETSVDHNLINPILESKKSSPLKQKVKFEKVVNRPNLSIKDIYHTSEKITEKINSLNGLKEEVIEQAEVQLKYSGYINKEQDVAEKLIRLENVKIPTKMDYSKLGSLSNESKEKLNNVAPTTIGQASRISGIKPTDINILLVYLGR
jgi:tRNA uridine 5-carboxymethylaminomethyl modification enzyme